MRILQSAVGMQVQELVICLPDRWYFNFQRILFSKSRICEITRQGQEEVICSAEKQQQMVNYSNSPCFNGARWLISYLYPSHDQHKSASIIDKKGRLMIMYCQSRSQSINEILTRYATQFNISCKGLQRVQDMFYDIHAIVTQQKTLIY